MWYFLILVFVIQYATSTTVEKCGSGPLPLKVSISGCDKQPCNLYHGTNVTLMIDFEALENADDIKAQVNAFSLGAKVNYPLPDNDVCDSLINGECPLDAGEDVTYKLEMPISSSYPSVPLVIKFSLVSGNTIVSCFSVSCQVV